MDYRNADGSIAQMCGNGVRVFAHYLRASGLESARRVRRRLAGRSAPGRACTAPTPLNAEVTVEMGKVNRLGTGDGHRRRTAVHRPRRRRRQPASGVPGSRAHRGRAGRPRRRRAGRVRPRQFPDGVNVEVLTAPGRRRGVDAGARTRCRRDPLLRHRHRRRRGRRAGPPGRDDRHAARCASPAARSASRSPTPPVTCAARRCWSHTARSPTTGGRHSTDHDRGDVIRMHDVVCA